MAASGLSMSVEGDIGTGATRGKGAAMSVDGVGSVTGSGAPASSVGVGVGAGG